MHGQQNIKTGILVAMHDHWTLSTLLRR